MKGMKIMNDLVSIIVPIYNVDKYIEKCVNSICNQSYKNIEIILVDDGSKDMSGSIIDELAKNDNRIKVVHKKNSGVSSARNVGIEKSQGKYICFVDGDDYIKSDYVEYLLKLLLKNDADISLTRKMFSNFDNKQTKNDTTLIFSGERAAIDILTYNIPIGVYCKMFKKSLLSKYNIRFREDIYIGEGFNFNVDAFQRSKKVAVGHRKTYYYRRDNETSATTKFSKEKWENGLYAIDNIENNLIIRSEEMVSAVNFARWRTNVDIYSLLETSYSKNKYKDFYKQVKKYGRKYFYYAFINKTTGKREKIRALMMFLYPKSIPRMVMLRRRKYTVDIKN